MKVQLDRHLMHQSVSQSVLRLAGWLAESVKLKGCSDMMFALY